MTLYGVPLSPFVRKVLFTLAELSLACERIDVAPQSEQADFRRASPAGRIPAFVDGDFQIADSAAICRYLIMRERSALLGGPSPQRQARIVQWETFGDDDLAPALLPALFERVVKPVRLGQASDEAPVEQVVQKRFPPVCERLEAALAQRGPWLLGETFSYADIVIGSHLATAELADILPEPGRYGHLDTWSDAVRERSGYQVMMQTTRDYIAAKDGR